MNNDWANLVTVSVQLHTLCVALEALCEHAEERDGRIPASAVRGALRDAHG